MAICPSQYRVNQFEIQAVSGWDVGLAAGDGVGDEVRLRPDAVGYLCRATNRILHFPQVRLTPTTKSFVVLSLSVTSGAATPEEPVISSALTLTRNRGAALLLATVIFLFSPLVIHIRLPSSLVASIGIRFQATPG